MKKHIAGLVFLFLFFGTVAYTQSIGQFPIGPGAGSAGGSGGGAATSITVGTTTISGGITTRVLYDNAGTLGEYSITGTGTVVAMQTSPTFITPALGIATGTSLALGGCTIGTDALCVTGVSRFSGNILAGTDNTYDIGANGSTRFRTIYVTADVRAFRLWVGGTAGSAATNTSIQSAADGNISFINSAGNSFGLLQLGGATSSFPAIKRSTATIQVRLADDSADADLKARTVGSACTTVAALPTAGTAGRRACITDQLTTCATTGVALTGGGAVVCPAFDNGTIWVGG